MSAVASVTVEVRVLERLDLNGLRTEWRRRYGSPPKLRSAGLLRLMLAWRIQSEAMGGLDVATRRRLRAPSLVRASLQDGARITKEWQGRTYIVDRVNGRFRWDGREFASLSAVAFAITSVKWNGPKFFGMRDKTEP